CKAHYGTKCTVCKFDFRKRYGEIGSGFIHVHHLRQHSTIRRRHNVDPIRDLRPVCPNCHAMLHRNGPKKPMLTIEQLRRRLR
ncbi:MAG: HNH endonuclease, partial [Tepidisphaeraceae bacterium]